MIAKHLIIPEMVLIKCCNEVLFFNDLLKRSIGLKYSWMFQKSYNFHSLFNCL